MAGSRAFVFTTLVLAWLAVAPARAQDQSLPAFRTGKLRLAGADYSRPLKRRAFSPPPAAQSPPPPPLAPSPPPPAPPPPGAEWALLWSDEFTSELNSSKWEVQAGDGCEYGICGWGNNELAVYTDDRQNLRVEGGRLVITARREAAGDQGQRITSARIRTYGKFSVAPSAAAPAVRIEARISVPSGTGMWPAFWMLPSEGSTPQCSGCGKYGGWAASGEIDIMETPNEASKVLGTLHYGGQWPANVWTSGSAPLPSCVAEAAPCFHTYSIEWNQTAVTWFLDGQPYYAVRSSSAAPGGWFTYALGGGPNAPFDVPFHLIINLAAGGELTGAPAEAVWEALAQPKQMLVDYVRVWAGK